MSTIQSQLNFLPNSPGIYLFYNSRRELIYVGKATSLKSRVRSYFNSLLSFPRRRESSLKISGSPIRSGMTRPIESMIHEVIKIKTIKTDSVLEAIILESNYIKKYHPKYNIKDRDDKSWNYLYLNNEKFPKLKTIRQHELTTLLSSRRKSGSRKEKLDSVFQRNDKLFGPFPSLNTRETLKLLHKLFYISHCTPHQSTPCFDYQLGQCLGVCTNEITPKEYKSKVIKPLTKFLQGHKKRLLSSLKKQMLLASKQQNFEEAARLRNQIKSLQHIQDLTLLNKDLFNGSYQPTTLPPYHPNRIEAYDISNLGSTGKVGSMIVFDAHGPVKSEYRKFKIKTVSGQSDVDCLKEIIERRFNNNWPLPDLILVDGGVPQVNAIKNILQNVGAKNLSSISIPIIGIAKGPMRKKNEFIGVGAIHELPIKKWIEQNQSILVNARDEAHRFAISYQKKLRLIA